MAHIIQCRLCKTRFDTEKEEYVLVGKRSYYHKKCYEEWVTGRNNAKTSGDEDFWRESVVDFLYRDVKMSIDFVKLDSQWKSFIKPERKMTPKGIYFALRYYYTVQHGQEGRAQGGIGIVPYIYKDSAQYWENLETRKEGTIEAIIEQIKARASRPVCTIQPQSKPQTNKAKFSLDEI